MQLPAALQPWRPWLDWFAPELAPALGDLLWRLQPLIGPRRSGSSGAAEPSGIEDLRRRGSYERLLLSEWAIVDLFPDEFLRRAATGEHLFLAPREVQQREAGECLALFDAGPLQLGAPRLAHLALWILLARRAAEMGMWFRWGLVQLPGQLHEALSPEQLKSLLKARTLQPALAEHWKSWQQLTQEGSFSGECWAVGPGDGGKGLVTHRVVARRSLQESALEVSLREGLRQRSLILPLPAQGAAVQLLKGQFMPTPVADTTTHQKASSKLSLKQPPLLSLEGRHVAVPTLGSSVIVFSVPDMPGGKSKRKQWEHRWSSQHSMLAAALCGKNFGGLVSTGDRLDFWQLPLRHYPSERPSRELFLAPPGLAHWLTSFWLKEGRDSRFYVLDKQGHLLFWSYPEEAPQLCAKGVLGITQIGPARLLYARYANNKLLLGTADVNPSPEQRETGFWVPLAAPPRRVLFSTGTRWLNTRGAWVVELDLPKSETTQYWRLFVPGNDSEQFKPLELEMPASLSVQGVVVERHGVETEVGLLALHADRQCLLLVSGKGTKLVYTAPARIATLSVGGNGVVAFVTEERQLMVYSLPHKALLLSVHSKAGEEA